MGTTDVAICNSALAKVGANRILTLADDSPEGRICTEQYQKVKQAFLRRHLWNFATKRVQLAALSDVPLFDFSYMYVLPEDCLRVTNMYGEETFPWKVEGRNILTDNNECLIKYISNIHEGLFDPSASEALAFALAIDICIPLTQSATLKESLQREAKNALAEARTFDAQESVGDRVYADTWLNARA